MFRKCAAKAKLIDQNIHIPGKRTAQNKIIPLDEVSKEVVCQVVPHYMYVEVSGLHGDQYDQKLTQLYSRPVFRGNSNGDAFKWTETLLKWMPKFGMYAFETWKGKDNLENHDEKRVLGDIPDSWPYIPTKSVNMLMRTDIRRAWPICESIRKGQVTDCSMGTIIRYSYCCVCGNKANTEEEWCNCLRLKKGQFLHPDELETPALRDHWKHGVWAAEDNREVYGIECSWITQGEGADPDAKVLNILAGPKGPQGKQFSTFRQQKANHSKIADQFYNRMIGQYIK